MELFAIAKQLIFLDKVINQTSIAVDSLKIVNNVKVLIWLPNVT